MLQKIFVFMFPHPILKFHLSRKQKRFLDLMEAFVMVQLCLIVLIAYNCKTFYLFICWKTEVKPMLFSAVETAAMPRDLKYQWFMYTYTIGDTGIISF